MITGVRLQSCVITGTVLSAFWRSPTCFSNGKELRTLRTATPPGIEELQEAEQGNNDHFANDKGNDAD